MTLWFRSSQVRSCAATILLSLLICGCSSIRVQVNKDSAAIRKVQRLFVIIQHGDADKQTYSHLLGDGLRAAFTNVPTAMELSIANPVELDEKAHWKRAEAFKAEAVLVITLTGGVRDQHGGYPSLIYDASLFEPKLDKRMWRARVDNSGDPAFMKRRMQVMSDRIVRQLRDDGVLD